MEKFASASVDISYSCDIIKLVADVLEIDANRLPLLLYAGTDFKIFPDFNYTYYSDFELAKEKLEYLIAKCE